MAPFKPQNMSNNAAACPGGGEIGRAQALQARAAGLAPTVDMNPVLLKPQSNRTSQVVVHGRATSTLEAGDFLEGRSGLVAPVLESFERLAGAFDLVVVEGAGSAAETNLRARDIANMGFARRAEVPVCLLADIDRGGVIAAVVGTRVVLDPGDAAMITSFAINKFRGDPAPVRRRGARDRAAYRLAVPGASSRGSKRCAACRRRMRWRSNAPPRRRPGRGEGASGVVAPMLSRIANFDDADPLRMEPGGGVRVHPPGHAPAARRRRRRAAGHEIDPRRSAFPS